MRYRSLLHFSLFLFHAIVASAALVEYNLHIDEKKWSPEGEKPVRSLTVNGNTPGPTIRFRVGDTARIHVHNHLKREETSIHWHGLLVPNAQDGVPHVTTPPIQPGRTHTFEFPITHAGTYWYHSHTGYQEQAGIFGSIVIEPATPPRERVDREHVIVLSDWSREKPEEIMRSLARGTEWYEIKKKTAQSLLGAAKAGALKEFWQRERSRMPPMDISDIAYDAFLINGQKVQTLEGRPGERIKLRVINASAATYFYLQSATGPLQIIAADGPEVVPIRVKRLLIGMAETYDLLLTLPPSGRWEIRATAQDGSGHASLWLGNGEAHPAPTVPKADNYRMDDHLLAALELDEQETVPQNDAEALANEPERPLSPYPRLRSPHNTEIPAHLPRRTITLRTTGDMERYVWSFNGKTFAKEGVIPIRHGEVIRLEMINDTMMHHPLHLHGAFFRLLMGQGTHSPLKHTVDLPPMSKRVVEFEMKERGDWLFHCHLLYHMHAGMTRIFSTQPDEWQPQYADKSDAPKGESSVSTQPAPVPEPLHIPHGGGHEHDPLYPLGYASLLTNYTEGVFTLRNTNNDFSLQWEGGTDSWQEAELTLGWRRYIDMNRGARLGLRYLERQRSRVSLVAGYDYRFPYLIWGRVEGSSSGSARISLEKMLPITPRLQAFTALEYDTREAWRFRAGTRAIISKRVGAIFQYHTEYGLGAGISITY